MSTLADAIAEQHDRAWEMFRQTIARIPEDKWRCDDDPKLNPARRGLHAVEAADWYETLAFDQVQWGVRFCDWEGGTPDQLPTKAELLEYLSEVAEKLDKRIRGMSDEELCAPPPYHWTGETTAGLWGYVLRHTMLHVGEMHAYMRLAGDTEDEGVWA